ncbi:SDR family oxidoreductase, partial [Streptomyces olivaceus]|uniref:SDR family oxidoreductase n=1 Tax=Streptomyces olivaceus TaxID=47716 RepID=UPI00366081A2
GGHSPPAPPQREGGAAGASLRPPRAWRPAHLLPPTTGLYSATKFAVRALSEGLRQESAGDVRVSVVSPGVTESELADSISDARAREDMRTYRSVAVPASAIADAIAFAVSRPPEVDVNEIVVRPAASAQ